MHRSELIDAIHAASIVLGATRAELLATATSAPSSRYHAVALAWVTDTADDHLLLARHRTRGWSCPGGHVDNNEALVAAACRELREETGIDTPPVTDTPICIASSTGCTRHADARHLSVGYRFRIDPATELHPEPGQPVRWFPLDALPAQRATDIDNVIPALRHGPWPST